MRALATTAGDIFIVDLPECRRLKGCFGFELEDGRVIQITCAREQILNIRGNLMLYCWHLGASNLQCQIAPFRLLIRHHPAIGTMMRKLGAQLQRVDVSSVPKAPIRLSHSRHHDAPQKYRQKPKASPVM